MYTNLIRPPRYCFSKYDCISNFLVYSCITVRSVKAVQDNKKNHFHFLRLSYPSNKYFIGTIEQLVISTVAAVIVAE